MNRIEKIKVAKDVELVEVRVSFSIQDRVITDEDISNALAMLYDKEMIEIVNTTPLQDSLTLETIKDYLWELKVNGENKICYNFGCCFIDSEDAIKLANDGVLKDNIIESLRILRGSNFDEHPLFFNDYADRIVKAWDNFLTLANSKNSA